MIPEAVVLPESLDKICLPSNRSVQFHGSQRATLEVREYGAAIGNRGGVASRAIAVLTGGFGTERRTPVLVSGPANGKYCIISVHLSRKVNRSVQHNGS